MPSAHAVGSPVQKYPVGVATSLPAPRRTSRPAPTAAPAQSRWQPADHPQQTAQQRDPAALPPVTHATARVRCGVQCLVDQRVDRLQRPTPPGAREWPAHVTNSWTVAAAGCTQRRSWQLQSLHLRVVVRNTASACDQPMCVHVQLCYPSGVLIIKHCSTFSARAAADAHRVGISTRPVVMASSVRTNGKRMATMPMIARGSCWIGACAACIARHAPQRHWRPPSRRWTASIPPARLRDAVISSLRLCSGGVTGVCHGPHRLTMTGRMSATQPIRTKQRLGRCACALAPTQGNATHAKDSAWFWSRCRQACAGLQAASHGRHD